MSAYEKEKQKTRPKRVDETTPDAGNSPEQAKPGAEVLNSPASKSSDTDVDRKKFFQSLLQSKNGAKVEATVPNTIPEESESEPNSPVREETKVYTDDSTSDVETGVRGDVNHSECNENGDVKLEHSEEGPSKVEDSLSATGVGSEVRGTEVAETCEDRRTNLPDKGLNSNSSEIGENRAEISDVSESIAEDTKDKDDKENSTGKSLIETKLTETDHSKKSDEKSPELPLGNENNESTEEVSTSKTTNDEKTEDRTTNDSEKETENSVNSTVRQDLLDVKDKPKDVDDSLTIAVKSSYIGAPSERSEATEVTGREEVVDPSKRVDRSIGESSAQSEGDNVEKHSINLSSPGSKPSSPNSAPQSGADSSPSSTPSAVAGTSSAGSPDQKSSYRAYVNIPEYLWSPIHQRLLGDLLFAIESDVQVWRR